ncbi:MAG: 50S ribosomal protein L18 [archaeon]
MKTLRKRRVQHKTDYGKRIKLLKSGKPRIVFRRTNKYFICQYVTSEEAKDKPVIGISSKALLKHGWPKEAISGLKSTPASYLTGYLFGKEIISKKLETPILDFGMLRMEHKGKTYSFIKGLIDSGLKVKCKEETFPDEKRISGEHLKNKIPFNEIKSKIESSK